MAVAEQTHNPTVSEMPQRQWFRPDNTADLTDADRGVLNRAARLAFPPGREPKHIELVALRTVYQPGMTADDLLAAADTP